MEKSGILYVVGTGPGSSELMTLGAVRTLQKSPVIFYPVTQSKSGQQKSRALETVKGAVDLGKKTLLPIEFSMRKNDSLVYEDAKEKCLAFLREGKDCAFVTIGDPSVFSTAGKFASMICGWLCCKISCRYSFILPGCGISFHCFVPGRRRPSHNMRRRMVL